MSENGSGEEQNVMQLNSAIVENERFSGSKESSEPTVVIESRRRLLDLDLQSVWQYRELLFFLVWRELKLRYRQTAIGAAWVVIQPLTTMIVFTAVFGNFAKLPSDGLPYPIFSYAALLPWNLFASALSRGGDSVVGNSSLVSKIYFPRLILPLSGALSPMVDFGVSFIILIGMMIWFGISPGPGIFALPFFIVLAVLTALAVSLWLSALNVKYRDVRHAIPFLAQIWLFASPVAYSVNLVPEKWRLLYSINPMVGVIDGFRWALLRSESPNFGVMLVSTLVVIMLFLGGVVFFRRVERTFADIV